MEENQPQPAWRRFVTPGRIVLVAVVIVALIFVLQNTESRDVSFLWLEFGMPTWLLILIPLGLGFALGWLLHVNTVRRRRHSRD
jgi:lipopolysaccharide assembly protein A